MGSVKGKVALITGGANGVGAEVARRLHDEGAKLVLTDLDEGQLKEMASALGDRVLTVVADVRDLAAMQAAVDNGIERNCPGWVGAMRWLRPLLATRFAESQTLKRIPGLVQRMDAEVAALGRSTSARTEAIEKR
jgi:NAD(P)-dependent dehydrogenase (short-subunit alcohol dehydrogenase family)